MTAGTAAMGEAGEEAHVDPEVAEAARCWGAGGCAGRRDALGDFARGAGGGPLAGLRQAGVPVHSEPQTSGSIHYVYVSAPDGVVIEVVELRLNDKLRRLMPLLGGVHKAIHHTRRLLAKQLFK